MTGESIKPVQPPPVDRTDHARLAALTDAEIAEAVASDPDSFIPDAAWFDNATVLKPPLRS